MGIFKGIEEAKVGQGGNYLRTGSYLFAIEKIETGTNRKKQDFVAAQLKVIEVLAPAHEGAIDDTGKQERTHAVGETVTWMVMLSWDGWLGKIKAFLAAAMGVLPEQIDEAGAEAAVSAENPFAGLHVRADVRQVITKGKGARFDEPRWSAVDAEPEAPAA